MTTLFLLTSPDGKISAGSSDERDFDKDLAGISGIEQYYEIEATTDIVSLCTGRTLAKIGVNTMDFEGKQINITLLVVDNNRRLTSAGLTYLTKKYKNVVVATTKSDYTNCEISGLSVVRYADKIDFKDLFGRYKNITIQSGGSLNSHLLREGLIDRVRIVVAPVIVGGKDTPTLVDGDNLITVEDLSCIKKLVLVGTKILKHSFLELQYDVLK